MRLSPDSGSVLTRGRIQWLRCGFDHSALVDDIVTLAPLAAGAGSSSNTTAFTGGFAGLCFDRRCRLFHAQPEQEEVEFLLWGEESTLKVHKDVAQPYDILPESQQGAFQSNGALPKQPLSLVADSADYLYIADPATPAVWLIDIWQHEVARQVSTGTQIPVDLCLSQTQSQVYALLNNPPGWISLSPCDRPQTLPWPSGLGNADRLDVTGDERALVLIGAGSATAYLLCLQDPLIHIEVPFCTDFLVGANDAQFGWLLVCALRPGEDFLQMRLLGHQTAPLPGLHAPNYDGRGIALAPDARVAYWTARGPRYAAPARTQYAESGTVYGFALDSNNDQNLWGTITLEACLPAGTAIQLYCFTRDDLDFGDALPRTPPDGESLSTIALPDQTPLPSTLDWAHRSAVAQTLFRKDYVAPLTQGPAAGFVTYQAPVIAPPGRFLWLVFLLTGTRSKTPRLRSARVLYPANDLISLLPKTLWRDLSAKDFLTRYLAPLAAMLDSWGDVSEQRQRLLNPRITPSSALPWLAAMLGLAMDPCWPDVARRQMIIEIATLFRLRGTLGSLQRMLEILTGAQIIILEKFRLRGGGVAGNAVSSSSVLGASFYVGGAIGNHNQTQLTISEAEAFDDLAHRFSVTIVANLSTDQLRCVQRLIEAHKPAHTAYDICTLASGSRVGLGLHIGLSSVVGHSSGFEPLTLGNAALGRGYLLGRPPLDAGTVGKTNPRRCPPGGL